MSRFRRWQWAGPVVVLSLGAVFFVCREQPAAAQVNREDLRPGLVAVYRDNAGNEVTQLDTAIAVALKGDEAAHPRLAVQGSTTTWEGYINVFRPSDYTFSVLLRGKFKLTIDGKDVVSAEVKDATALKEGVTVKLPAGAYTLKAEFTRLPGEARLEVYWQAPIFIKEPLPLANLRHLPAKAPETLTRDRLAERGRFVVEELSCVRCHQVGAGDAVGKGLAWRQGPDLAKVGERYQAAWIYQWLKDPRAVSPSSVMPAVFGTDAAGQAELYAVTRYLESLGGPVNAAAKPPKIDDSIKRGKQLFSSVGCVACHPHTPAKVVVPDAPLLHHLVSDSGPARQFPLAAQGRKTTPARLAAFLQDPTKTDPSGRMPHLLLDGKDAADIANYLCFGVAAPAPPDLPSAPEAAAVAKAFAALVQDKEQRQAFDKLDGPAKIRKLGEKVVTARGCANCHSLTGGGKMEAAPFHSVTFDALKDPTNAKKGCLADDAGGRGAAPDFHLGSEREAVRVFLARGTTGAGSPSPPHAAKVALQRFNCLVCHSRDGEGGLTPELATELRKYEKSENAEAISPPTLSGVGHKLLTPWFRDVLTKGGRSRQWMALRMPQFGDAHVGKLPEAVAALEGTEPSDKVPAVKLLPDLLKAGRQLIGKNNGYSCISCHDIAGIANGGTRGPDLVKTSQHVRYDWYRRWLESAQRMDPGTKMPSIILDGKVMHDGVLGGNADAQAEAMWAYLSLGPTLPLPDGLEPPKGLVLAVKDRAVMLRTFMPEAGSKAIAIGYPAGLSVAFDANQCRLAYGWSGNFLDATPVWANRGGAPAKVLGTKFWTSPPGVPWAFYDGKPPDFAALAADPAYGASMPEGQLFKGEKQLFFEGYTLDKGGSPSFTYRLGANQSKAATITERITPLRTSAAIGLERHFDLANHSGTDLWLNVSLTPGGGKKVRVVNAKGEDLEFDAKAGATLPAQDRFVVVTQDDGRLLVLTAEAGKGVQWHIEPQPGGWQVLLRFPGETVNGSAAVRVWSVSRDNAGLLKEVIGAK
jgi:cytochrome c